MSRGCQHNARPCRLRHISTPDDSPVRNFDRMQGAVISRQLRYNCCSCALSPCPLVVLALKAAAADSVAGRLFEPISPAEEPSIAVMHLFATADSMLALACLYAAGLWLLVLWHARFVGRASFFFQIAGVSDRFDVRCSQFCFGDRGAGRTAHVPRARARAEG